MGAFLEPRVVELLFHVSLFHIVYSSLSKKQRLQAVSAAVGELDQSVSDPKPPDLYFCVARLSPQRILLACSQDAKHSSELRGVSARRSISSTSKSGLLLNAPSNPASVVRNTSSFRGAGGNFRQIGGDK